MVQYPIQYNIATLDYSALYKYSYLLTYNVIKQAQHFRPSCCCYTRMSHEASSVCRSVLIVCVSL